MKKSFALLLTLVMLLSLALSFSAALAEDAPVDVMAIQEVPFDKENPNYAEIFAAELHNFKVIRSLAPAYEKTSWDAYYIDGGYLANLKADLIDADTYPIVEKAVAARKALKQVKSFEDCIWYIWGDDMASVKDPASLEFTDASCDFEGYRPFLVPYLLKDQSKVKGNLIVIAGGGYSRRSNINEGYPIAERFNELGYNCFVLQRRVEPFAPEDAWMDLQRSIRYLRSYAKEKGLGGIDCVMAAGFSGGGHTIAGAICNAYGDVQPTIYDADYKADEIDALNSDLDVALLIYGPIPDLSNGEDRKEVWKTENTNLPYVFIASGFADITVPPGVNIGIAQYLEDKTVVELHVFANTYHGFGVGREGTNATFWIPMADNFVEIFKAQRAKAADAAK